MIFSTYKFIFLFLPITFCGYFLLGKLKQRSLMKIWLVCCSLFFYAQGDPSFFPTFVLSIFFNYIFGSAISAQDDEHKGAKKALVTIGVLANVALLGYYKYTDFFLENVNAISGAKFNLMHIALPIGISFFTFQLIAYLIDSYRGLTKSYNIIDYLLFITFFPQLIVGPIVHHSQAVPQFENDENGRINARNLAVGLLVFGIGCAKKILLADPLTTEAQTFWAALANVPSFWDAWYHAIEYTISYYFDLSGYADMAIGLGLMFNIIIPENFNSPYKARNFQDYWRRWHMTLSNFLSEYIFRSWYDKKRKLHGYYAATMVTFFVSGFWHGAGWTFVVWGLINGALVCAASWMKRKNKSFPAFLAYPLTAIGVVACRVLFVSDGFTDALLMLRGLVNFGTISAFSASSFELASVITLALGIAICWFMPNTRSIRAKFEAILDRGSMKAVPIMAAFTVLFMISIMYMNKVAMFLYFQF